MLFTTATKNPNTVIAICRSWMAVEVEPHLTQSGSLQHLPVAAAIDDYVRHVVAAMEQVNIGQGLVVETIDIGVSLLNGSGQCIRQIGAGGLLAIRRCRRGRACERGPGSHSSQTDKFAR
jgi:hypothetical protein